MLVLLLLLLQLELELELLLQLCVCSSAGIAERAAVRTRKRASAPRGEGGKKAREEKKHRVCKRKSHTELHAAFWLCFFTDHTVNCTTRPLILSIETSSAGIFFGRLACRQGEGKTREKTAYKNRRKGLHAPPPSAICCSSFLLGPAAAAWRGCAPRAPAAVAAAPPATAPAAERAREGGKTQMHVTP